MTVTSERLTRLAKRFSKTVLNLLLMTKSEFKDTYGLTPHADILRGDFIALSVQQTCTKHKPVVTKYGVDPCAECQREALNSARITPMPEFTTDAIREGRKEYASDQIQEFRQGERSREYLELYPEQTKRKIKDGVLTKEDVKKARYVWKDRELKNWERNKKIDARHI